MFRFARWLRPADQKSTRTGRRRQQPGERARPLRLELLEDRRLLAYTVGFDSTDGYLTIAKASGDTAALGASEAGGNLNITDSGGTTFSSGTLTGATGVTVSSTGVTINESATNVTHIVYDFTTGTSNSNDNITFSSMASPVQGFDMLGVAGSHDAVVFAGALTTSSGLPTSGGSAATASITLTNLPYVDINGTSVAIATAGTAADAPGNVNFGGAQIYAQAAGNNLAINTSPAGATGAVNGGTVTLTTFSNDSSVHFVNNLAVTTLASGAGIAGPIDLTNTASITTDGTQTYDGPVVISGTALLTSHGAGANGNITFDSTAAGTDGNESLSVSSAGLTDFKGVVGGSSASPTLGQLDIENGSTLIEGGSVSTTLSQIYSGAITITENTTFTSTSVGTAGNISFDSTVGGSGDAYNVTVSTTGVTTFNGVVGGSATSPTLDNLDITQGATQIGGGFIFTKEAQTYNAAVTVTRNTSFENDSGTITNPGQFPVAAPGGNIAFNSTLDGSGGIYSISIRVSNAELILGGAVGGSATLPDISTLSVVLSNTIITGGVVRTAGFQEYANVTLGNNTTLTSTGDPSLGLAPSISLSSVDGAFNLLAESDGSISFDGSVGGSVPLASLTSQGYSNPAAGTTWVEGNVTTKNSQTYNNALLVGIQFPVMDPVVIVVPTGLPGWTDTLTSTAGNLTFNSTVGGNSNLTTSSAGTTTFNALVSIGGLTAGRGITRINTGTVNTVGPQTYNAPVLLANNPELSSTQSTITFNSTVGGNSGLSTNSSSTTTFNALVSIASLTTGNFNGPAVTSIHTGTVTTVGPQTYNAPVLLAGNPVLTSTQNSITFNSTVGGNSALTTSSTGTTTFNALVSIASLTIGDFTGHATTNIHAGKINTVGSQTYNAPVLLANNPVLTSGQGNITFNSTVGGSSNLTINNPGTTTFKALVSIAGLAIAGSHGTTDFSGGTIQTTGAQTYGNNVVLTSNTIVSSNSGGNIEFDSLITPASSGSLTLTVKTTGQHIFKGATTHSVNVINEA